MIASSCQVSEIDYSTYQIDIQGHRGCRGILPENTIPAFRHALDLGVHTLELDVVISKDHQVIVSHDPFLHHDICSNRDGNPIVKKDQLDFNLYQMSYEEIKSFDCGLRLHSKFKEQQKIKAYKPSLSDAVTDADAHARNKNRPLPQYNIEIKRKSEWDNEFHPPFAQFVDLVMNTIDTLGIQTRSTVQCFDTEVLQYLNTNYPDQENAYLIMNNNSVTENLTLLGFVPDIYAPTYRLVDEELVAYCKSKKMKIIPWTINHPIDMKRMLKAEVDGIITDYPDRLISILAKN